MDNSAIHERTHKAVLDRRQPPTCYWVLVLAPEWAPQPLGPTTRAMAKDMPMLGI